MDEHPITRTRIRLAEPGDAQGLARFLRALGWFHTFDGESEQASTERVQEHLKRCLADDSHTVLVAVSEAEEISGYLSVHWLPYLFLPGPEGFVSELFVGEAWRGHGVGGLLLRTAEQEARKRGCWRMMLINNRTRESYQRAFYKKQGWEEREQMANFVLLLEGRPGG